MTPVRRVLVPLAVVLAGATGAVVTAAQTSSASSPQAAPVVRSKTIAGTDLQPLDPHMFRMFVGGGGAMPIFENSLGPPRGAGFYLETGIDFPDGAKVTSVQVTVRGCGANAPQVVFGSYQPTTGNTVQNATLNFAKNCTRQTLTKTGNPITTVVSGRRYAIDYLPNEAATYPGDANHTNTFYGATIKYTCTSPCVP